MEKREQPFAAGHPNPDAFNQLVLIHQQAVYRQAYWLLRDEKAAEDVAQDAFLQAYRNLSNYRGGSFRAWLLRIVINACYTELRRRKRSLVFPLMPENEDGEEIESPSWLAEHGSSIEEVIERKDLRYALKRLLEELPGEYRTVVTLIDVMEMNYAETARVLQVPIGTVKSRLARARLRLKRGVEKMPEYA